MKEKERLIIYQVLPRIFTNMNSNCVRFGTYEENGSGKLNDYTPQLLKSLKDLGVNCVWYTGVIEHATKTSFVDYGIERDNPDVVKGEAGSPYAIKDYYDVDPVLAVNPEERMKEFEALVKRTHDAGLKVMLDFVPNHTARRYHSDAKPTGVKDFGADDDTNMFFTPGNNYYYITNQQFSPQFPLTGHGDIPPYVEFPAKATGNDCFTAFCTRNDWYETVKLNYGHDYGNNTDHFDPLPDTWRKMYDILYFWALKGVDGFRCDMVFMVPLAFWHWVIPEIKKDFPNILFVGEIYDVGLYRPFIDYGHFDYLYDKVNLYDTLVGIERSGISAAKLTGCWQTVDGIGERMLNFIENHDEVRFGSKSYAGDPSLVLPTLVVSSMMSKGPFMIYFGQELGERATDDEGFAGHNDRTTIFDYWSYDTMRRWYDGGKCDCSFMNEQETWLCDIYRTVLHLCNSEKALREGNFFDLMYVNLKNPGFNPHRQFAFFRYVENEILLVAVNFDRAAATVKINIPELAFRMIGLPQGETAATDLLTGKETTLHLDKIEPCVVRLNGKDAVVLKLKM